MPIRSIKLALKLITWIIAKAWCDEINTQQNYHEQVTLKFRASRKDEINVKSLNFMHRFFYLRHKAQKKKKKGKTFNIESSISDKCSFSIINNIIKDIECSSNINEVIRAVLNSLFFLWKDFARTKSTKNTKRHKDATKQKHITQISE